MNRRLIEAQDRLTLQAARQTTAVTAGQFARASGVAGRADLRWRRIDTHA